MEVLKFLLFHNSIQAQTPHISLKRFQIIISEWHSFESSETKKGLAQIFSNLEFLPADLFIKVNQQKVVSQVSFH